MEADILIDPSSGMRLEGGKLDASLQKSDGLRCRQGNLSDPDEPQVRQRLQRLPLYRRLRIHDLRLYERSGMGGRPGIANVESFIPLRGRG